MIPQPVKIGLAVVLLGVGFGAIVAVDRLGWINGSASGNDTQSAAAILCPHGMPDAKCPFCDESLINSMGFCHGHSVPEALCTSCWPAVRVAFKAVGDWCIGHSRPESQCELCNPGTLSKFAPVDAMATETPQAATGSVQPPTEPLLSGDETPRHLRNPSVTCTTQKLRVEFTTPEIAKAAGIEVEKVTEQPVSQSVSAPAELHYDSNRHARLKPRTGGIVHEVKAALGDTVAAGQVLAVLESAELSQRKAEYLRLYREAQATEKLVRQLEAWHRRMNDMEVRLTGNSYLESLSLVKLAEENFNREESLIARGATSKRELMDAQNAMVRARNTVSENERKLELFGIDSETLKTLTPEQIATLDGQGSTSEQPVLEAQRSVSVLAAQRRAAHDQLRVLGLDPAAIQKVVDEEDTSGLLAVTAPFAGVIIDRQCTLGEMKTGDNVLFAIADISLMWAILDVKEADLPRIRMGQSAILDLAGLRGQRFAGMVTWLSTQIDRRTRTLKVRVTVDNPDGLLRAGMYGSAEVTIRDRANSLILPREALQWDGCCNLVFVRHSDLLYEPRKVKLGYETDRFYLVDSGLRAGEEVVTTGSFLMKTEIMKGNIGAGCCEVEPGVD